MAEGIIVKGIGGFYYVDVGDDGALYECRARGIFRKNGIKPTVGDRVVISVISEEEKTGSLDEILPRKSYMIRPMAANITQAIIVFAAAKPAPNTDLLDRFLVLAEELGIKSTICVNKTDLDKDKRFKDTFKPYETAGYKVLYLSAEKGEGIQELKDALTNEISVFAGPSGVGKSSLINGVFNNEVMRAGEISRKIDRGKHTTRHAQLIKLSPESFAVDSPGFTSLFLEHIPYEKLENYFAEFAPFLGKCRFNGCGHINEPDCAVKKEVGSKIARERYESYKKLYEELKSKKKEWRK